MRHATFRGLLASLALALVATAASAAMVQRMGLDQIVGNADKVFRGTVIDKFQDTVRAGGSDLPVVVYRFRVSDAIKGDFGTGRDAEYAEVRMIGRMKPEPGTGAVQHVGMLDMNPSLDMGAEYVLFTTPPSRVGLSTTVGLDQGLFRILLDDNGNEVAVNGVNNQGLFQGPVSYDELTAAVRRAVNP